MNEREKYFIDLSKLSEEQINEIERLTKCCDLKSEYNTILHFNNQNSGDSFQWVNFAPENLYQIPEKTELLYPEFIKLFEGGEGEKKCCDNPDIQWNKVEIYIGDKQGSYKDLNFNFCDNCGETFNEVFD